MMGEVLETLGQREVVKVIMQEVHAEVLEPLLYARSGSRRNSWRVICKGRRGVYDQKESYCDWRGGGALNVLNIGLAFNRYFEVF